ncbi:MAG: hypothetical protein WBW74_25900 [Xanthobacteraceae bacterium]
MSIELIVYFFVAAFVVIAAVGHVLLIAAICRCVREDYFGGRGRKAAQPSAGWLRAVRALHLDWLAPRVTRTRT